MSKNRREVRTLDLTRPQLFEEQTWVVQTALFVLMAYLAGIVFANFSLTANNPASNGFVWLAILAIAYAFTAIWLQQSNSRRLRRGLMLSFFLSLILNVSFLVGLSLLNLFVSNPTELTEVKQKKRHEKVIEYDMSSLQGDDRQKRELTDPVETGRPDISRTEAISKQVVSNLDAESDFEPAALETSESAPMEKIMRQLTQTAPRFSDLQGTISRQSIEAEPIVGKPIPHELPNPQRTPQIAELEPSPQQLQRTLPEVAPTPLDLDTKLTTERQATTPDISRKTAEQDVPEIASAEPTLRRRVDTPFTLPNAELEIAASNATAEETEATALRPQTTVQQKLATSSPEVRPVSEPLPEEPIRTSNRSVERTEMATEKPEFAQVEEQSAEQTPTPTRPSQSVSRLPTETVAVEVPSPVSPSETSQQAEAQPTNTSIARQVPTPSPDQISNLDTETAELPETPSEPTESTIVRNAPATAPDSVAGAASAPRIQRSNQSEATLASDASPLSDTQQSLANVPSATDVAIEPTAGPIAVSKSIQGVSGSRAEPNFESESPAKPNVVTMASASAQRQKATQQSRPGPALSPSESPVMKRARAQSSVPSATMIARDIPGSVAAGAAQPESIDASSAATITKSDSNAPLGLMTAQQGEAEVDFGPTRIASSTGQTRASGGGQPSVNLDTIGDLIPRSSSQSPAISTNAVNVADIPTTAAGSGEASTEPEPVSPSIGGIARRSPAPRSMPASGEGSGQPAALESESTALADVGSSSQPSRRQSTDAPVVDETVAGGGTNSPSRASRGRAIVADNRAPDVSITGTTESTGSSETPSFRAEDVATNRAASGIPQRNPGELVGALADSAVFDGKSTGDSQTSITRRTASMAVDTGPTMAAAEGQGLPVRRSRSTRLPTAAVAPVTTDVPPAGTDAPSSETALEQHVAIASQIGDTPRSQAGGLLVRVDATESIGGLLADPSTTIGINRRRSSPLSSSIAESPERFVRKAFGGPISVDLRSSVPTEAFQNRLNRQGKAPAGGEGQPSPKTEQAIELGLVFLSTQQLDDGSWSLNFQSDGRPYPADELASIRSDTAATGLGLLTFLGAGYHHRDDKYAEVVDDALNFLVEHQSDNGDLYITQDQTSNLSARLYSHAIATIALCEAYGMTQDPKLKIPAQRALEFIAASQHKTRGGWRYSPGISSDTSVTGWMMMALKSGELANLDVDAECFAGIENWLERSQAGENQRHLYRYNPWAPDNIKQRHGKEVSHTMTAVGLLMRLYNGWRRDRDEMVAGASYLMDRLPEIGSQSDPKRDTYYWYYATQVMFHMGGEYWAAWNARLHPILTNSQIQSGPMAGSWNPTFPVADRWAPHGGRIYVTTLNLLSLEVYYRHLPIYEETAK